MSIDDKLKWIEKYIDHSLTDDEQKEFESMLKEDLELSKLLEQQIKLNKLWNDAKLYKETKSEVNNALRFQAKKHLQIKTVWIYSLAAVILLFIGITSVILFTAKRDIPSDQHYADTPTGGQDSISMTDFKLDKPESKATFSNINTNRGIELIYPDSNQRIIYQQQIRFVWYSENHIENIDTLFIRSLPNEKVLILKPISLKETSYILDNNTLKPGKYSWTIGRTSKIIEFLIENKDD
ncbi:MAG: hypothetical protein PF484_07960 [Bacteroidales bacterium]|jgi:hypothetical protein|nr:hypothetical protein [Bacteroidales bacterium]